MEGYNDDDKIIIIKIIKIIQMLDLFKFHCVDRHGERLGAAARNPASRPRSKHFVISTEDALRKPMTYDNQSHPIHPTQHIALHELNRPKIESTFNDLI